MKIHRSQDPTLAPLDEHRAEIEMIGCVT